MAGMLGEVFGGELMLYCEVGEKSVGCWGLIQGGCNRPLAVFTGCLHVLRVGMKV